MTHFKKSYLDALPSGIQKFRDNWAAALNWIKYPKYHPAYDTLLVSPTDEVWARRYSMNAAIGDKWDIFARNGTCEGYALLPHESVLELSREFVVTKFSTPDGDAGVHVWRLRALPHRAR